MSLAGSHFRASDGTDIGIYRVARSDGGRHPGLIIFPSIFGVTDELEQHANEIAETGVVVLAFDPFARAEDSGPLGEADRERAFERMGRLDFASVDRDFRELLAALKQDEQCNGRVVGLGVCLGAGFVWKAAADAELAGVATWHGSLMGAVMDRAAELECPVIMDFGDEDPIVPLEELETIQRACKEIDRCVIRVHPGAGHGFSHTGWDDHRPEVMAIARPALEQMLADLRD